jgi:hypothetical protein
MFGIPPNIEELWNYIQTILEANRASNVIDSLIESMPDQIQESIEQRRGLDQLLNYIIYIKYNILFYSYL